MAVGARRAKLGAVPDDATGEATRDALEASLDAWERQRWTRHALAIALLALVIVTRYFGAVTDPVPRDDEAVYLEAFALVAEGRSPYETAFYYPPALAHAGAWLLDRGGTGAVLATMRVANVLGLAVLVWIALAFWPTSWRWRTIAGALFVALAPAVRLGMLWGNLSLAVAGMIVAALLLWPRRPLVAGVVLGLSAVIKPLAPAAIVALGTHRPANATRRQLLAAGAAVATIVLALVVVPGAEGMLAQRELAVVASRNVSLHRLLYCFGLAPSPLLLAAVVALAAVAVARRRPLPRSGLLALAPAAAILATPLVWSHTLLLLLPLQVQTLVRARARRYHLAAVVAAVLALQLAEGVGGIDDRPLWVMGLATAPAALAPLALAAYGTRPLPGRRGNARTEGETV